jgi:hypothetical protein
MLQLTPHDVVNLKLNKGDASTPSLGQGIVYRIKVNTYSNILPCAILPAISWRKLKYYELF